jgi:DNA (cytosine-5)-methyltransferase 1
MGLTHGSLFAGIGGFDLGFHRAGFGTLWQVNASILEKTIP